MALGSPTYGQVKRACCSSHCITTAIMHAVAILMISDWYLAQSVVGTCA